MFDIPTQYTLKNTRKQEDSLGGYMTAPQETVEPKQGLFSFEDAARFLGGISTWTLRAHARRGSIQIVRLGARIFFTPEELERIRRDGLPSLKAQTSR
jgi:hypothetical protein